MLKKILLSSIALLAALNGSADEGMWMPHQLKEIEAQMKALGLEIPVSEIYSEDSVSLKDAVVQFGGGCTGEVISPKGLVLTNHHCGYSQIQGLSTMENNYVKDGFWASDPAHELPCPGLTVTFVIRIENVTNRIFDSIPAGLAFTEREKKIASLISVIEKEARKEKWQQARVRPFYHANEYYLFIMETFRDIRLVGAPPSSLGRFGGDTDNWMWPRHTCDFSLFRIYADSSNKPADYSDSNKPFTPRKYFTISTKGIQENDFSMVYGFPGRTTQYIPSFAVDLVQNVSNPARVSIRDKKLSIWRERMNSNDTIKLKYASKYGTISNYWKKWSGEMQGLQRSNVIVKKQEYEQKFTEWVSSDTARMNSYSGLLHEMELFHTEIRPVIRLNEYYTEGIQGTEIMAFLHSFVRPLAELSANDSIPADSVKSAAAKLRKGVPGFFKNYDAPTDEQVLAAMLKLYRDSIDPKFHPGLYGRMDKKFKGDYTRFAKHVFSKSLFTDEVRLSEFLNDYTKKSIRKIRRDPAYAIYTSFAAIIKANAAEQLSAFNSRNAALQQLYMKAQKEMLGSKTIFPDANLTMRISYGQVKGYHPRDAITYSYYSTLSGVVEKYLPGDPEFDLPEKLIRLNNEKDFVQYAANGTIPVAFVATNHTTGGNSGSPVINSKGELIGTNFDRTWEGTLSDIQFDISSCRNIALDIRYTLFIIEKLGDAKHLIDEMVITGR